MPWPFSFYSHLFPADRYVWAQVRILHETPKAILVSNVTEFWIPKSQIRGIRLRRNRFEIHIMENFFG